MLMRFYILLYILISSNNLCAQLKGVIVNNRKQAVELVQIQNLSSAKGTVSSHNGHFAITVNDGDLLCIEHLNYQTRYIQYISGAKLDTIVLSKRDYSLSEINVVNTLDPQNYLTNKKLVDHVPSFLGEQDVLKYIATLPGATALSMLDAGIYVRGGNSSQNAFLINNVPVSDPNHLTGILSTFDPYILATSRFYKSGYPSAYNGYLSSYINMKSSAYNTTRFNGEVSAGLLSSSLKFKVKPDKKGKLLFGLSMRKSYYQLMADAYNKHNKETIPSYSFNDITSTLTYRLSNTWNANITLLTTNDNLPLEIGDRYSYDLDWNSFSSSCNINGSISKSTQVNFSFGYNQYASTFDAISNIDTNGNSKTNQCFYAVNAESILTHSSQIHYGLSLNTKNYSIYQVVEDHNNWNEKSEIGYAFAEYSLDLFKKVNLVFGINASTSLSHSDHLYLSPRVKLSYNNNNNWALWMDYADTRQFEERMTFFTLKSPVDFYVPIVEAGPSKSKHLSLGSSFRPSLNTTLNVGLYLKQMSNIKDFNNADKVEFEESITNMVNGKGEAYGFEIDWIYQSSGIYVRVNYTFSELTHQFSEINNGQKFNPPYDIRHNILFNGSCQLKENITFNVLWTFLSGSTVTIPIGVAVAKDIVDNNITIIPVYGKRYNYRLPSNHRLDVNLQLKRKIKKGMIKLDIGAYNLYNQQNPSFVFVEPEAKGDYFTKFNLKSKVLLPFMPYLSISYIFNR